MADFREQVLAITLPEMPPGWRNHLITLTYHEMGLALEGLLGDSDVTWPHFAKWTSFTVGFDLRVADPPLVPGAAPTGPQRALHAARRAPRSVGRAVAKVPLPPALRTELVKLYLHTLKGVGGRLFGRSVSLANRGVFFEVGGALADFIETFDGFDPAAPPSAADLAGLLDRAAARPEPPGERWARADVALLQQGLSAYFDALSMPAGNARAERILLGTIALTEYEQHRLQSWLRLSLLSPHRMGLDWVRRFLAWGICLRPDDAGPPNPIEELVARAVTQLFVGVRVPGEVVRASRDLRTPRGADGFFAPPLAAIQDPALTVALQRYDPQASTRSDGSDTRVANWLDLCARMRFIGTWFRSRQRVRPLLDAPYSQEEVRELDHYLDRVADRAFPRAFDDADPRLAMTGVPSKWTDNYLDRMREQGDPVVDKLLGRVLGDEPLEGADVTAALRSLLTGPPEPVRRFKRRAGPRPVWVDGKQYQRGQAFYEKWRFQINMGLLFASLPGTYAAERGVQVLSIASQLANDPHRRVLETARFLEDVMRSNALEPGSTGFVEAKNVRLLHGLVRRMVDQRTESLSKLGPRAARTVDHINRYWDPAWGVPANREDMLGTLLAFAVKPLEFLEVLGVGFTKAEADAYVHAWCCVGLELGVKPGLLTLDKQHSLTYEQARQLMRIVEFRNLRPNWAGQWLASALLEVLECMVVTKSLPRAFVRIGSTPGVPEMLGIPRARLVEAALTGVHGFFRHTRGFPPVAKLYTWTAGQLGKRLRRRIDEDPRARQAAFRADIP